MKGLKTFLRDSIRQVSLVKIFPQAAHITNLPRGIFPPRSLTRQDDWPTKITCDIAHAIPRVGKIFFQCCSKIHLRKVLKNCLFPWFVYFEASARTFLQGKGILLKLLKIACQSCERQTVELVQFVMYAGIFKLFNLDGTVCIYLLKNFNRFQDPNFG